MKNTAPHSIALLCSLLGKRQRTDRREDYPRPPKRKWRGERGGGGGEKGRDGGMVWSRIREGGEANKARLTWSFMNNPRDTPHPPLTSTFLSTRARSRQRIPISSVEWFEHQDLNFSWLGPGPRIRMSTLVATTHTVEASVAWGGGGGESQGGATPGRMRPKAASSPSAGWSSCAHPRPEGHDACRHGGTGG